MSNLAVTHGGMGEVFVVDKRGNRIRIEENEDEIVVVNQTTDRCAYKDNKDRRKYLFKGARPLMQWQRWDQVLHGSVALIRATFCLTEIV
ncbi:hypothetical protein COT97_00290 [Candidatus Falkowbacteria bacterium CG10_big_fil_rev_8_21_14_0_10_39_11]|uniref:Uncharacterized protein n=1 Tax=Candidatus Falkowbacteria bacterium CG10_big_fil_rev_8_21_14_0_10_39_11 TaxID=1974565 RepID=A0A2H0V640_9BACT|nr:MAG: hypothetical protein COT97_00290 [Candidatus Falkowbacteria bacterium CG10_big_fil_rev_8_21_14_0_10_39_11]